MELRNRGTRRDAPPAAGGTHDVGLGPTVYAGERYGKMSERIKRQKRHTPDVEKTALRAMAPRFVGLAIGLVVVACCILYLRSQMIHRRNQRRLEEQQWGK